MLARDEQLAKALSAMEVTLSGMVILVREEQCPKAPSLMEVVPSGIVTESVAEG